MYRRRFLAAAGLGIGTATAGCLSRVPGRGLTTEFDRVSPELAADAPPDVAIDGDTVTARGTVMYGSSSCGAIELAHAGFERSQNRLDLLIVAADDRSVFPGCTDDLVEGGYRVTATVSGSLRRVAVTEHHVFGETYSTTAEP